MPRVANVKVEINQRYPTDDRGIDITDRVRGFSFGESILTGESPWELELVARDISSEDDIMFDDSNLALKISATRDGVEYTTGWRAVTIEESALTYRISTPVIVLRGNSLCSNLKQFEKWRVHKNRNPREIASTLASEYGLRVNSLSLDTRGTWLQIGETDWSLIHRVCKDVLSTTGNRRVWVHVDNLTLRLFSLDFSAAAVRNFAVSLQDDRVDVAKFRNFFRTADWRGGGEARMVGFDLWNKQELSHTTRQGDLPVLAPKLSREFFASYRHRMDSLQSLAKLTDYSNREWIENASKYFSFHVTVAGDVALRAGQLVELYIRDAQNRGTVFNGRYPVYEVMHKYKVAEGTKGLVTHIGGFRRGFYYGDIEADSASFSRGKSNDTYSTQKELLPDPVTLVAVELL